MKSALLATVATIIFFAALSLVAYVEQKAINEEKARYANAWCNVDFGSSKATIECNKVSRLD